MKQFIKITTSICLCLILSTQIKSFAQSGLGRTPAEIEHEKCIKRIEADYAKKQDDIENVYYEDHKGTLLACDDHCPKYWCKKHHKQCNGQCSCAFDYKNDLKTAKSAYELELKNCENDYKKAIKIEEEKQATEEKQKAEKQKNDAIKQQQLEQQQAQLKQQQAAIEQRKQQLAQQQAEQQRIKNKIIQGQQDMQAKTNQTISNSIQQGADALTNYADFLANENAKKEQARQQQEAQQRQQERQRAEEAQARKQQQQQQEIEEQQRKIAEEQKKNTEYSKDLQILGNYFIVKKANDIAENIKQVYYITYERSYISDKVYLNTYTLNKYNDGTWMMQTDMLYKIGFSVYTSTERTRQLLGAFENKQTVQAAIAQIKANQPNAVINNNFTDINGNTAANSDKDFWKN